MTAQSFGPVVLSLILLSVIGCREEPVKTALPPLPVNQFSWRSGNRQPPKSAAALKETSGTVSYTFQANVSEGFKVRRGHKWYLNDSFVGGFAWEGLKGNDLGEIVLPFYIHNVTDHYQSAGANLSNGKVVGINPPGPANGSLFWDGKTLPEFLPGRIGEETKPGDIVLCELRWDGVKIDIRDEYHVLRLVMMAVIVPVTEKDHQYMAYVTKYRRGNGLGYMTRFGENESILDVHFEESRGFFLHGHGRVPVPQPGKISSG